jgi:hypothetical protein
MRLSSNRPRRRGCRVSRWTQEGRRAPGPSLQRSACHGAVSPPGSPATETAAVVIAVPTLRLDPGHAPPPAQLAAPLMAGARHSSTPRGIEARALRLGVSRGWTWRCKGESREEVKQDGPHSRAGKASAAVRAHPSRASGLASHRRCEQRRPGLCRRAAARTRPALRANPPCLPETAAAPGHPRDRQASRHGGGLTGPRCVGLAQPPQNPHQRPHPGPKRSCSTRR